MPQTPLREIPTCDRQIVYPERTWEQFEQIQKGFENSLGIHLFYYAGTIEILIPGLEHELFGHVIGCLVTLFLTQKGIFFQPRGSITQQRQPEVSAQPDQSYCIGAIKPIPDLSIEVVVTSGGVDKLARYRALGVPEVWFWQDGVLWLYASDETDETGYRRVDRSQLPGLEDLDLAILKRCILMAETDVGEAVRTFQQAIS
jgi:Uma2 family endonuclease